MIVLGFFRKIAKVFTAPRYVVAKGIEKLGNLLSSSSSRPLYETGWFLENVGDLLTPRCYKTEEASAVQTRDFGLECQKLYNQAREQLVPRIQKIVDQAVAELHVCKDQIQLLVTEDVFLRVKQCIPDDPFSEMKKSGMDEAADKISANCDEFMKMIKISDDIERKRECERYIKEALEAINQSVGQNVEKEKNRIILQMLEEVIAYCNDQEILLSNMKESWEEWQKKKDDQEFVSRKFSEKIVDITYLSCILNSLMPTDPY